MTASPDDAGDTDQAREIVRSLFGRDSIYLVLSAAQMLATAALTPVITRLTGSVEFGRVAAANAVMQLLFVVAGLGLQTAVQREHARDGGRQNASRLLTLALVLGAALTLLADATGRWWSALVGFDHYAGAVRFAVLWAGASAVTQCALALLRSQERLWAFGTVTLLQSVVAEALSVLLLITVAPTASVFVFGQWITQLVTLIVAVWLARPAWLRRADWSLARSALWYSVPLVPAVLSELVFNTADRLVVHNILGDTAVARYQIASNVGSIPILVLGILHSVWLPRIFSARATGDLPGVLAHSRDALYQLLVPVILGLAAGAPLLLRFSAPSDYRPDDLMPLTAITIISVIPYAASLAATRALLATDRTKTLALVTVVIALANVGLNVFMVTRFDLLGAALARMATYTSIFLSLQLVARMAVRAPATPARLWLQLIAASVGAGLVAALPATPLMLSGRVLLAVICACWFLRVFVRIRGRAPRPAPARALEVVS